MRLALALLLLAGVALAGCTDAVPPADVLPARDTTTSDTTTSDTPARRTAGPLSPDSLAGPFEGHYSAGFEHSGFVPCADSAEVWWTEPATTETRTAPDQVQLDMRPAADIHARYTEAVGDSAGTFGHGVTVFARLRGRATPRRDAPAGFGHLGAYSRAFAVDSVEAVVRDTVVAGCPAPQSVRP